MGRDRQGSGLYVVHREEPVELNHVGLVNLGNSCFFNTIIQCLSTTPALAELLAHPPATSPSLLALAAAAVTPDEPADLLSPLPITQALIHLLTRLASPPPTDESSKRRARLYNPKALLKELSRKHEEYGDTSQQDAHELLRHLLDGIFMEEVDYIKKVSPPPMPKLKGRKRSATIVSSSTRPSESADEGHDSSSDSDSDSSTSSDDNAPPPMPIVAKMGANGVIVPVLRPFIDTLFGGKLTSVIVCSECLHVSRTTEDFLDLSLSIPNNGPAKMRKRDRIRKTLKTNFFSRSTSLSEAEASPSASETDEAEDEDPTSKARLGRRKSLASLDKRPFWSRGSASRDPSPSGLERATSFRSASTAPSRSKTRIQIPKPTAQQQAYVKSLLTEIPGPSSAALQLRWATPPVVVSLRPQPSGNSATSVESVTSGSTDLHECLRQFTAVETLEDDNRFACRNCWKLLHPEAVKAKKLSRARANTIRSVGVGSAASTSASVTTVDASEEEDEDEDKSVAASMASLNLASTSQSSISTSASLAPPPLLRRPSSLESSSHSAGSSSKPSGESEELTDEEGSHTDTSVEHVSTRPGQPGGPALLTTANLSTLTPSSSNSLDPTPTSSVTMGSKASVVFAASVTSASVASISAKPKPLPAKLDRHILRKAHKRYLLSAPDLPPILVLQFKRFQSTTASSLFSSTSFTNLKKVDTALTFPTELDLAPFLAPVQKGPKVTSTVAPVSPAYTLYAVVEHIGSLGTGHYSCYFLSDRYTSKSEGGDEEDRPASPRRWLHASDDVVRTCSVQEVLRSRAYMLFYEKAVEHEGIKSKI